MPSVGGSVEIYPRGMISVTGMAPFSPLVQVMTISRSEHGITRIAGVCGGDPCIKGTRLPVWVLYQAKLAGVPDAEILESYPFITPNDLKNAWRYAQDHMEEIQNIISESNMW